MNPYRAGALMRVRDRRSARHQRAGRIGGESTARLHRGKHRDWGRLGGRPRKEEHQAGPTP